MRPRALLLLLLVPLHAAVLRAQGEPHTFDLVELDRVAALRHVALRETVLAAERRDSAAAASLLALAGDSATHALDVYPALLFALLTRLGDHAFASLLSRQAAEVRTTALESTDRGAGFTYERQFPETWALGPHASALLPDT